MTMNWAIAGAAALLLAGCAAPKAAAPEASPPPVVSSAAPACPAGGGVMAKTELYFGMAIPGGGKVSERDWAGFLNAEVTPRFPDGLTVDETAGQWRDAKTGKTVREPSRVVMVLYEPSAAAEAAIEAIRDAYKTRFRQDSVMRLDETDCVAF